MPRPLSDAYCLQAGRACPATTLNLNAGGVMVHCVTTSSRRGTPRPLDDKYCSQAGRACPATTLNLNAGGVMVHCVTTS
ncbi:hypothetical protein ACQKDS_01115 [Serratia sp. NPDC078593]|uniref:hypothetical protein n=1 Tax=unclassified Serratia (in: enterobacteria) TaxID=2647522 RepID=UPI0037D3DB73